MPIPRLAPFAGLLLLVAGAACRPRGGTEVAPAEGAPGTTAVVRVPRLEPGTKAGAVEVAVGGRPATVLRVEAAAGIEFLVPESGAGPAEVVVRIAGREAGRAPFAVLSAPARQLVLALGDGKVELVSSRGAAGLDRPSRETPVGAGLSWDLVTSQGALVATGALPHPLRGRLEVFDPEGTMRGAPVPKSVTFTLRIPAVPKGSVLRFFEVEPGTDLSTPEGRASRRPLSEIEVGG